MESVWQQQQQHFSAEPIGSSSSRGRQIARLDKRRSPRGAACKQIDAQRGDPRPVQSAARQCVRGTERAEGRD
ncbi:unnamed protein product [Lampetra fluviatilis]